LNSKVGGATLGIGLIVLFFLALVFVPPLFQTKSHQIPLETSSKVEQSVPLDFIFTEIELSDRIVKLKGKVSLKDLFKETGAEQILLNLWASWCPPCIEEMPSLEKLHHQLRSSRSLTYVVGVNVDEGKAEIAGLIKTLPYSLRFRNLWDSKGEFAALMGTSRFPESYLIGSDGRIKRKWIGPQNWLSEKILQYFTQ